MPADRRRKHWKNRAHVLPEPDTPQLARRKTVTELRRMVEKVPSMDIWKLPEVVDAASHAQHAEMQSTVLKACLQRILAHIGHHSREPRHEQVRTLRRLIYHRGDVLLIARTGFGKSLIFHAYSLLTRKITIQIVPLTKLGEQQLGDIEKFPRAKPILINMKTRSAETKLIEHLASGGYSHVLLGPEQATTRAFRNVCNRPEFQACVGLVAIDECHLIRQWQDFRPAFTMMGVLRTALHPDVCWFGCTATLDSAGEECVLSTAGFRQLGSLEHQTMVLRTSVDRPDVSLCVVPLPRSKLKSWDVLWFLFREQQAFGVTGATPSNIPKTIIFIDGKKRIHYASVWIMETLVRLSSDFPPDARYTTEKSAGPRCVINAVRVFTATSSQYDRDTIFAEFMSPSSQIRVIIATTVLGMGINIADVDRVVTHGIPITRSLGDLWQRLGRGGRGEGRTSKAFVLLPYYLFDSEGREPVAKSGAIAAQPVASQRRGTRFASQSQRLQYTSSRNQLPSDRAEVRRLTSQLSQSMTPGDISEPEDDVAGNNATDDDGDEDSVPVDEAVTGDTDRKTWTPQERKNRSELAQPWFTLANGQCHRKAFLEDLGEMKLPPHLRRAVPAESCCNRCNVDIGIELGYPPAPEQSVKKPRAGSKAAYVLKHLELFASERAAVLYRTPSCGYPMPSDMYLDVAQQWRMSYDLVDVNVSTLLATPLRELFPFLGDWTLLASEEAVLVAALSSILDAAAEERQQARLLAAAAKAAKTGRSTQLLQATTAEAPDSLEASRQLDEQQDNETAYRVAEIVDQGKAISTVLPRLTPRVSSSLQSPGPPRKRGRPPKRDSGMSAPVRSQKHARSAATPSTRTPTRPALHPISGNQQQELEHSQTQLSAPGFLNNTPSKRKSGRGVDRPLTEKGKLMYRPS